MKKILSKVLILFVCGLLCSCQLIVKPVLPSTSSSSSENNSTVSSSSTSSSSNSSSSSSSLSNSSSSSNSSIMPSMHVYNDFTANEKAEFIGLFDFVIPFIPTDEYDVEQYYQEYDGFKDYGINYYTFGNTATEFNNYLSKLSNFGFISDGNDTDDNGDTWYYYSKGNVYLDVSYYYYESAYVVDLYVYYLEEIETGGDNTENPGTHTYSDFTSSEKSMFNQMFGFVIPFIPNNEYYVEEYSYDYGDEFEEGINFYAFGNTQSDFNSYLTIISNSGFYSDGTDVDDYGDTWYYYSKGDVYLDVSYYYYESAYVIDLYIYYLDGNSSGSESGSGGDSTDSTYDILTNNGKGLPKGTNGVHNVNFNNASYVKNVHDQGYYLDGCPTEGDVRVLVIPIEFSDRTASSLGYDISKIEKAFNGNNSDTSYYSVANYFKESSYNKLNLTFDVCDNWFKPSKTSTYYENLTQDYDDGEVFIGDQVVMDEALEYLSKSMDLSVYDSDNNSIIDAVVLITTLKIDQDSDYYWAYRYWNLYTDEEGYYYEYDNVSANDYLWCSYQFLYEDEYGNYDDENAMNTYTFIHEFSHVLGADDYYDYNDIDNSPLEGYDMMDYMIGDHNAFTKFNYGWINNSRLVVAESNITLNLESFAKSGDTIIIANNWDDTLGAYQEYYVLMYYTNDGLNSGKGGYFENDGVVMYHINSSLYKEVYGSDVYYDIYYNNSTPNVGDYPGTTNNLIEFVKYSNTEFVYTQGCTSSNSIIDDQGNKISYTFTVDSLTDEYATITFNKNN